VRIAGLVLNVLGVLALWFGGVPYKEREKLFNVVEVEREKTVAIPPPVGAGMVAAGTAMLLMASFGGRRKKD
jgi:hypothetical protein